MSAVCPAGHLSQSEVTCDICGVAIAGPPGRGSQAATLVQPSVAAGQHDPGGTTDETTLLAGPSGHPGAVTPRWVAEVWVDPLWYQGQQTTYQLPAATPPTVVELGGTSMLIGRRSHRQHIDPELDCSDDPGVSRRHAELIREAGTDRWCVVDVGSSNGTFVAGAGQPLPDQPLPVSQRRELASGDQIYLGAWTKILVRLVDIAE
ncbi:MAG: FHA domain-containing protein [Actinomycetales bacterium]